MNSEARKLLRKVCPAMFESAKKKRERHERLLAMFKTRRSVKVSEKERIAGDEFLKALAETHGYELE